MMYLQPPLDISRCHLIAQLHNWINTITGLQRIQSSHYQVFITINNLTHYINVLLIGWFRRED